MIRLKQISTGSEKGNCYIYNDYLMLDVGVSYNKVKDVIEDVKIIFISHEHLDHINHKAVQTISEKHPNIMFVTGSQNVAQVLEDYEVKHLVMELGKTYNFGILKLRLVKLYHDVENYGVRVFDDLKGIYLTDTAHLEGISFKGYDWAIAEFNHCAKQIEEDIEYAIANNMYTHLIGSQNSHLSFQDCDKALDENMKDGAEILKVHMSSSYDPFYYDLHYYHEGKGKYKNG